MKALRAQWRRAARAFDARARRERIVLIVAACAAVLMLADRFWITPAFARLRAAGQQLAQAEATLATLQTENARMRGPGAAHAQMLDAEIAQWKQRLATQAQTLRAGQAALVGPQDIVTLLERMLPPHGRLRVRELRSLGRAEVRMNAGAPAAATPAPAPASTPAPAAAAVSAAVPGSPAALLYRHGVELTVEGQWPDLVAYLQALETMPQRVLWGDLVLKVEQHPRTLLTLRVYTLSLDRGWLEI